MHAAPGLDRRPAVFWKRRRASARGGSGSAEREMARCAVRSGQRCFSARRFRRVAIREFDGRSCARDRNTRAPRAALGATPPRGGAA